MPQITMSKHMADFCAADDTWHAEIVRLFGKEACNVRYKPQAVSTPKLQELKKKRDEAMAIHLESIRLNQPVHRIWEDD